MRSVLLSKLTGKLVTLEQLTKLTVLHQRSRVGENEPVKTDSRNPACSFVNSRDGIGRVEFFYEFQENFRIPTSKYENEMVTFLKRKYEGENLRVNTEQRIFWV